MKAELLEGFWVMCLKVSGLEKQDLAEGKWILFCVP